MRLWTSIGIALLILFCRATIALAGENSSLPIVVANDNRTPAGKLKNGILDLRLELREGVWYPEQEGGGHRDVYGFAEEGEAPQCSGPLIRVPEGTQIHIRVRNTLPLAAKIYGLHSHPGDPKDALSLAPGERRQLEFLAGDPGTYPYWGTTSDTSLDGLMTTVGLHAAISVGTRRMNPSTFSSPTFAPMTVRPSTGWHMRK